MKLPLSWLKEFVDLNLSVEALAEKLLLSGTKVEEVKKISADYIFDFEITPNRPDCLSVIGIAREIAALTGKNLKLENPPPLLPPEKGLVFRITAQDPSLVPVYAAIVLDDLNIKNSKPKIADRLVKSGLRPILNLIDISNYIMLQTGQPTHFFDYDQISGHNLHIRESLEDEKITLIDGQTRELEAGAIIIEDNEKLIDLVGLMGGKNTEITTATKRALLFVPIPESVKLRKASLFLGLRTEASSRFEKQLDLEAPIWVLERTVNLCLEENIGKVASPMIFYSSVDTSPLSIEFDLRELNHYLGTTIPDEEVEKILKSLSFDCLRLPLTEIPTLKVTPPSFRRDVTQSHDLVEEVVRIYGYNKIPTSLPKGLIPERAEGFDHEREIKTTLSNWGLNEGVTYTLISKQKLDYLNLDASSLPNVSSPTSVEFEYLRPTLLIGLLESAALTQKNIESKPYFEIGRCFPNLFNSKNLLDNQKKRLTLLIPSSDLTKVKGYLETLLRKQKIVEPTLKSCREGAPYYETSIEVLINDLLLGTIGILKREVTDRFNLTGEWSVLDIDFARLLDLTPRMIDYKKLPRFPEVHQDLSLIVDQKLPITRILKSVKNSASSTLKNLKVFDIYTDPKLGFAKKSITLRLTFQSPTKTLRDEEVNNFKQQIIKSLEKEAGAKVRGLESGFSKKPEGK